VALAVAVPRALRHQPKPKQQIIVATAAAAAPTAIALPWQRRLQAPNG